MPAKPAVPESALKKQKRDEEQAKKVAEAKKAALIVLSFIVIFYQNRNIEKKDKVFLTEQARETIIRNKRLAKAHGNFYVPAANKIMVVVRIRGIMGMSPKVKTALRLLRLRQIHNCVFIRANLSTIHMLRLVEPYVAFGAPTPKLVRQLIYKRGFAKINHQRIPISDNQVLAAHLGVYGIKGVEDLVHEIVTCGPHFKEANNFLWPMKLTSPRGGFDGKLRHFNQNGVFGDQEHLIHNLIERMI